MATLRSEYGEHFAADHRKDMMLKTLLKETDRPRCTTICAITTREVCGDH